MFYPYIEEGGLMWMLPIVFLSFCSLAFCLERGWYWIVRSFNSLGQEEKLYHFFRSPFDVKKAMDLCAKTQDVVLITLHEFLVAYENVNLSIAERKTRMFAEEKVGESRHFLDLLSLIANISGTLGLMGTVVGISITFKSLAMEDSKGISRSLATALYTTVAGIILFLLSYLCLFFFQKLSDRLETVLDNNIQKLKDLLESAEKSKLIFENTQPLSSAENGFAQGVQNLKFPDESAKETSPTASADPEADEEEDEE